MKFFNSSVLHAELKQYLYLREKQKNDRPLRSFFLNHNIWIHVVFLFFLFWESWIIISILIPKNNQLSLHENQKNIVFNSAFNYVFKTFENGQDGLSSNYWYREAYFLLSFAIVLFFLKIYLLFLLNNWTSDLIYIFDKCEIDHLKNQSKRFVFYMNILAFVSFFNIIWTTISLLFVPFAEIENQNSYSITTFLFHVDETIRYKYFLPITNLGYMTLFLNIGLLFFNLIIYMKFQYEKFYNNPFFFKDCRKQIIITDSQQASRFNKNLSEKFLFLRKRKINVNNTAGYFAELENVEKIFYVENKKFKALKKINLKIKKGEFIVILGPSGSGKTTLLNILSGIDKPSTGKIILCNYNTILMTDHQLSMFRRKYVGYVFQHYALLPNLNAHENVAMAAYLNSSRFKKRKESAKNFRIEWKESLSYKEKWIALKKFIKEIFIDNKQEKDIDNILDILHLTKEKNKYPNQLSGGQQQRVAIARALIKKPKILFGDEATGALDHITAKKILEVFSLINIHGKTTVILITHNPQIAEIANRVLIIKDGTIEKDIVNQNPKSISELKNL